MARWASRFPSTDCTYSRRKKSGEALTEEEQAEHQALRREYVQSVLGNLDAHLANTYLVDEHGNKRKLRKKGESQ